MISGIDTFIKNIEEKDKIITYLKNIYKIEVGSDAIIPEGYIKDGTLNDLNENFKTEEIETNNQFSTFEEKIAALNLPSVADKNIKLKIAKWKKEKDTKYLIKHLDLSNYYDKGISLPLLKQIFDGIKILKSVEDINLKKNNLDESYCDTICDLFIIENLKRIDLSFNNFTKNSAKKLAQAIKSSNRLEYLDLSFNPFCSDEFSCSNICTSIRSHPNLYHFGISDASKDSAVRVLSFKPDLRSLNLDDSKYKLKAFEFLAKYLLDKKSTLAVLSMRFTYIDLFCAGLLEKSLRLNKSLVYLNLYSTGLSDIAGSRIISLLDNNKTIIEIDLGANFLSENFSKSFNRVVKLNNTASKINISKNYLITNESFGIILEGLVNNGNIVSLGNLSDMKIGVKMRESAEIILQLNNNFINREVELSKVVGNPLENSINIDLSKQAQEKYFNEMAEMTKSQKMNFFKSSIDFEGQEKLKRETIDLNREETKENENEKVIINEINEEENRVIQKYDIKLHRNLEDDEIDSSNFFVY